MKTVTVTKSAGSEAVTAEQLKRINLFTRRELAADEVYVFSVILCDNGVDRDGEVFPLESLEALGELFIGKTGVFDHNPKAENQSARIFETKIIKEQSPAEGIPAEGIPAGGGRENALGEPYACLKAWAYMVRCDKNADLILEIDAGIKKEVSVGCSVERVTCSVCGADQKIAACAHQKGKTYDGMLCCHLLENPTDAYEWSFVAVPAQKNAGVTRKSAKAKGEIFLNLTELFEANGDVMLDKSGLDALKAEYDELRGLAGAGKAYIDSLRRDVVKLAALAKPDLQASVMESITKKLDIPELTELRKTFAADAAGGYPLGSQTLGSQTLGSQTLNPQLGGRKYAPESRTDCQADSQFKI